MSLINEALRKARLEAARQDAARRGISYPTGDAAPRRLPVKTLASAVFVVALVGAVLYWLGARSAQNDATLASAPLAASAVDAEEAGDSSALAAATTIPSATTAATAAVRTPPAARPAATKRDPPATIAAGQPSGAAPAAPPLPAPPPAVAPTPPAPRSAAAAAPEPATENSGPAPDPIRQRDLQPPETPAVDAPSGATAAPPPAAAQTFVGEATIAGAGTLRLGGIAWSERQPFALINGRVVGPGDQIQGLQVDSVGRAEVVLRADRGTTYVLRLR